MNCSLEAFKENFPEVGNKQVTNLGNDSVLNGKVENWINLANIQAREQGFEYPLYSLEYRPTIIQRGNKFYKDNSATNAVLTIHEKNLENYQHFVDNDITADIDYGRELASEIMEEMKVNEDLNEEDLSDKPLRVDFQYSNEDLFSTVLYSPSPSNNNNNKPVNFGEWVDMRKNLLFDLHKQKKEMITRRADRDQLQQINKAIFDMEEELSSIDMENVNNIHSNIVEEINNISRIIDIASASDANSVLAANIFENNKISNRLADLGKALQTTDTQGKTLVNLHRGLDPTQVSAIIGDYNTVKDKYNYSLNKILNNIMLNNEFMMQLKHNINNSNDPDKIKELKELEDLIQELLDPEVVDANPDGDGFLGSNFLGARSYDSILTEIIIIIRDINQSKEVGITLQHKKKLQTSYENIVNKKYGSGKNVSYFIDRLWAKDEFNQNTPFLISPFTGDFYKKLKYLDNARHVYAISAKDTEEQTIAYESWMESLNNNVSFIEPYRLSSFKKMFGNHPDFQEFFTYTDAEMAEYEKELRDKLGNTAYEVEVEKQRKAIDEYLLDGFINDSDKYHKNPMRFMANFYSDNYKSFDENTGDYILPTYANMIPLLNEDKFFNSEFKEVEKEGGKDFEDFYLSAMALIKYSNDIFNAEGINVNLHDVINMRDSLNRNMMKDLSFFGKIWKTLSVIRKNLFSEFYDGSHEKNPNDREFINTHYDSYGRAQFHELKNIYESKSFDELKEELNKRQLIFPSRFMTLMENANTPPVFPADATEEEKEKIENKHKRNVQSTEDYIKSKMATAIATNEINKSSSLDILKRINYATSIAESISTRNNTLGIIKLAEDFARENKLTNTSNFIKVWVANNIIQPGSLTGNMIGRLESKPISFLGKRLFGKKYTEVEEAIKALYLEEKNNIDLNDDFNFTYNGYSYRTDPEHPDGKYLATKLNSEGKIDEDSETVAIPLETVGDTKGISNLYEEYLENKINRLGRDITYGKIIGGFAWNMFRYFLYISPKSGFNNRMQGKVQNNQAAAAGIYGFDTENLLNARWLLAGYGVKKLADYSKLPKIIGLNNTKRYQQMEILVHLAQNLQLLSNVMDDISGGDGNNNNTARFLDKTKEFLSDFSMNIPEFYNQMELLVAMLQSSDYNIKDIHGNERPFFDPKTMSFPFDPKTMKLLPIYRTEENILNWEKFDKDKEDNSPQAVLIQNYQLVRDKLQGNYRTNDKIALQSTMTGRGASSFAKWSYEAINNQYGTKRASLTTASVNIKGRKVVLMERFPVMLTHMAMNNLKLVTLATGAYGFVQGAGVLGAIASISVLSFPVIAGTITTGFLINHMIRNRANIKFAKADFALAYNYALEVGIRTLKTTVNSSTMNVTRNLMPSDKKIKDWTKSSKETYTDRNSTFKERQIMSESAQELADKFTIWIQFAMGGITLKFLYMMLMSLDADDDDDKERFIAEMEKLEGHQKYLMNIRNNLLNDTEKWTSPTMIKDTYTQSILFDFIINSKDKFIKAEEKYEEGKISKSQMYFDKTQGVAGPILGAPKMAFDLVNTNEKFLSNNRVYDNTKKSFIDDYLLSGHLKGEAKFKPLVDKKRRKLRVDLEEVYEDKLKDTDIPYYKRKEIIKKNIDNVMKKNNLRYKKGKVSYSDIHTKTDWDDIIKKAKKSELKYVK